MLTSLGVLGVGSFCVCGQSFNWCSIILCMRYIAVLKYYVMLIFVFLVASAVSAIDFRRDIIDICNKKQCTISLPDCLKPIRGGSSDLVCDNGERLCTRVHKKLFFDVNHIDPHEYQTISTIFPIPRVYVLKDLRWKIIRVEQRVFTELSHDFSFPPHKFSGTVLLLGNRQRTDCLFVKISDLTNGTITTPPIPTTATTIPSTITTPPIPTIVTTTPSTITTPPIPTIVTTTPGTFTTPPISTIITTTPYPVSDSKIVVLYYSLGGCGVVIIAIVIIILLSLRRRHRRSLNLPIRYRRQSVVDLPIEMIENRHRQSSNEILTAPVAEESSFVPTSDPSSPTSTTHSTTLPGSASPLLSSSTNSDNETVF